MEYQNEIPKYHKKRKKQNCKADHKHEYLPCLIRQKVDWAWVPEGYVEDRGTYCCICGKIGEHRSFWFKETREEWNQKNPNAPILNLEKFGQKFFIDFQKKL